MSVQCGLMPRLLDSFALPRAHSSVSSRGLRCVDHSPDLPEGGTAHVLKAVYSIGAGPVPQPVLGSVVHDAAQELARVVSDGGEEEQHADADPPADPHRVWEAQEANAHEAVGAIENRLGQGGQAGVTLLPALFFVFLTSATLQAPFVIVLDEQADFLRGN